MTISNLKKSIGYAQTCADHDRQTKNGPNKMLFLVFFVYLFNALWYSMRQYGYI